MKLLVYFIDEHGMIVKMFSRDVIFTAFYLNILLGMFISIIIFNLLY